MLKKNGILIILISFALAFALVACGEDEEDSIRYVDDETALEAELGASEAAQERRCKGPNPAGCASLGCDKGEECAFDTGDCVPSVCGCVSGQWVCTADCGGGVCVPAEPYDACDGKECGEYCSICDPNDPDCVQPMVVTACDLDGECVPMTDNMCEDPGAEIKYDPCEDKSCGDNCTICHPDDPDCFETMVIKVCDEDGQCVADTGDICPIGVEL